LSGLSEEYIKKLYIFIVSDTTEDVIHGLYLLDTLEKSIKDINDVLQINQTPIDITSLTRSLKRYIHCHYIKIWYVCKLVEYQVSWAVNISSLNLQGHLLDSIPDSIELLTNLTTLNLWRNQLTTLPESIVNLSKITNLNLYGNELTTLPESIGNLTLLTYLHLSYNQLTTLPESIENQIHLELLNLHNNPITDEVKRRLTKTFGDKVQF